MILPNVIAPPAPNPHSALPTIKLSMLPAAAHHAVASANTALHPRKSGLRPTASDRRPSSGWKAVEVSRKAVDSHDAELAAPK